ncbi:MAG: hypothetical protein IH898_13805 [Planctomycetes bacterium]|nr:hypothetical protein [Planctomycetota bacterium]
MITLSHQSIVLSRKGPAACGLANSPLETRDSDPACFLCYFHHTALQGSRHERFTDELPLLRCLLASPVEISENNGKKLTF